MHADATMDMEKLFGVYGAVIFNDILCSSWTFFDFPCFDLEKWFQLGKASLHGYLELGRHFIYTSWETSRNFEQTSGVKDTGGTRSSVVWIPSGELTVRNWKWPSRNSGFSH